MFTKISGKLLNEVPALTLNGQYIVYEKKEYFMHFLNHEPGHIMVEVSKKNLVFILC